MTTGRSPDLRRPAGNYIDCEITATLQEVSADRLACVDCVLIEPAGVDGTGLQALQALQARAPDVPVVVLTRIDDPETGLESLRRGAQDYLVKSRTDADTLARAIRFADVRQRLHAVQRRPAAEDLELHDDVIQQLFAIGVAMQTTEQRAADQPGFADRITDHLDGLHRVLQQARSTLIDTEPESPSPELAGTRQVRVAGPASTENRPLRSTRCRRRREARCGLLRSPPGPQPGAYAPRPGDPLWYNSFMRQFL